jgi:GNAT superfamily N-acetyltransferase
MDEPIIRPFLGTDLKACLRLFESNCPPFFDPSERADFEQFLTDPADRGTYFVLELGGEALACGGVFVEPGGVGGLSWGMVRQDRQRQGLGTVLTDFRLEHLRCVPGVREVRIDTSQHTEAYYARHGFLVTSRREDGFAPGLHEIKMSLHLRPLHLPRNAPVP